MRKVVIYTYTAEDLEQKRFPSKCVCEIVIEDNLDMSDEEIVEHYLLDYCTMEANDIQDKAIDPDAYWDEVRHQREWVRGKLIEVDGDIEKVIL